MSTFARTTTFLSIVALVILFIGGCDNQKTGSLYDASAVSKPAPAITGVSPSGSAYAGMDTIVISGTNFSSVLAENTVYFNTTAASLLKATSTQITLMAPLVTLDSVAIRVAVFGSDMFSNTSQYKLKAGVAGFGGLLGTELATSLTTDASGNLYSGFSSNGTEAGLVKFTSAGARSSYAPGTAGVATWTSLKMGPGGVIFGARNVRAVYQFVKGGGASATLWVALPTGTFASDIEFDQSGNLWVGGNNSNIYRIASDKTVTPFAFVGSVHSMRVYNGYLYFAARTDAGEKVYRAQISSSGLGTPEIYFDFATAFPTNVPLVITFSSDGILYIGTDSPSGVIVVNPDKSFSAPFSAYNKLYSPSFLSFAWGAADDLYATSASGILMKITVRGKKSAPYFGSTL
jgi:hypothetical protein